MSWKEGELRELEIRAERDLEVEFYIKKDIKRIELAAQQIYRWD